MNERIGRAVIRAIQKAHADGTLPESLIKWVSIKDEKELPSIRSCVTAPEGMILVESDYATAEMVALAKISGDKDLQRILEEPDPEWAELKPGNALGAKYVRVRFAPEIETGIPAHKHKAEYLMTVWKDGELVGEVSVDDLARNADGTVKHRGYDIHWSIAERIYERPREEMVEKIYRNAAKVINFSSAYGASPASLERKIESDTGVKPEEGVGQKGLDAIRMRQPRSTEFLEEMAEVPKRRGYYRAASGRICHCVTHSAGSGVGWRQRNATESSLGREMRNFPYLLGELKLGELRGSPTRNNILIDFRMLSGNPEPSRRSNPSEGATTRRTGRLVRARVYDTPTSAQPPQGVMI